MRIFRYFLHFLQLGLVYAVYLVDDLYKNHLGFMRNVSFYSHKVEASTFGSRLFLLPLLLVAVALFLAHRKSEIETLFLTLMAILFLAWQLAITLETTPIYYLVSGILCLGFLLQLLIVLIKREQSDELLKRNT